MINKDKGKMVKIRETQRPFFFTDKLTYLGICKVLKCMGLFTNSESTRAYLQILEIIGIYTKNSFRKKDQKKKKVIKAIPEPTILEKK